MFRALVAALLGIARLAQGGEGTVDTGSEDPPSALRAADVGVVVNTDDLLSVSIGEYYVRARHIPLDNVARVRFSSGADDMQPAEFTRVKSKVDAQIGAKTQVYALTWARPFRAGCMSITAAFAFGFDPSHCASSCKLTKLSGYFNAPSSRPYNDLHIHPAMSLAATDFATARALIDRGVRSDATFPRGTAYLVTTPDAARSGRSVEYGQVAADLDLRGRIQVQSVRGPAVEGRSDVLFYFIGAVSVPGITHNRFLPGAIADHLTSFGGMLTDSSQMSSLRWIEAGATGSYGTVVEPCGFPDKFPDVRVLIRRYLAGETLIEAYWKSVAMPGQGLFIGEPLAAPFRAR